MTAAQLNLAAIAEPSEAEREGESSSLGCLGQSVLVQVLVSCLGCGSCCCDT